ncbi:MAG: TonB-dependent receptor [Dysgonamonadaceae bacterium]
MNQNVFLRRLRNGVSVCLSMCCILTSLEAKENQAAKSSIADTVQLHGINVYYCKPSIAKLDVPLGYLPVPVNAISGNELGIRGVDNLKDVGKFVPGVVMDYTYGGFLQISTRGFDHTPVMIDGIRDQRTSINNSYPFSDLSSVSSIEVLKGPSSVLYGQGTVGGVFNIVRKAPSELTVLNVKTTYGSWDYKRGTVEIGGRLTDGLSSIFVFNWSNQEGYRHTNDKNLSGYMALNQKIRKNQNLELRMEWARMKNGTDAGLPPIVVTDLNTGNLINVSNVVNILNRRNRYNNDNDFLKNTSFNTLLTYRNKINENLVFENKFSYMYDDINYKSTEGLNYQVDTTGTTENYNYKKVATGNYFGFAYRVGTITEQMSLNYNYKLGNIQNHFNTSYNYIAFLRNHNKARIDGDGTNAVMDIDNPLNNLSTTQYFKAESSMNNFTNSVSVQNLTEFNDHFKMLLSGSFDHFRTVFRSDKALSGHRTTNLSAGSEPEAKNYNNVSYRFGLVYIPVKKLSFYSSVSNFFMPYVSQRSSTVTFIDKNGNTVNPTAAQVFDPLTGYQIDGGVRFLHSDWLQLTANAFYIKRQNEPQQFTKKTTTSNGSIELTYAEVQLGESLSQGAEFQMIFTPFKSSRFAVSYAYTDAHLSKEIDASKFPALDGYLSSSLAVGTPLNRVAKNTFNFAGYYMINTGYLKGLDFNCNLNYRDSFKQEMTSQINIPARTVVDCGLSFPCYKDLVRFGLNVNNLFNKKYYEQMLEYQIMPAATRSFMVHLSFNLN